MTSFRCIGLSSDKRTNRWELELPCGHKEKPSTTLFSTQVIQCSRCLKEFMVNYNDQTMREMI